MTSEDQKFFEDARTMFLTDGWQNFVKELEIAIESIQVDSLTSADEFWQAKGRLAVLRQLAGYENAVRAAEEQYDA
jgi:hypothetical protein